MKSFPPHLKRVLVFDMENHQHRLQSLQVLSHNLKFRLSPQSRGSPSTPELKIVRVLFLNQDDLDLHRLLQVVLTILKFQFLR